MIEQHYTVQQVAELLQVSERTIRRKIKGRAIEATRVAGQWRIPEHTLQDYLDLHRQEAMQVSL